jgi:hypothetical protein
MIKCVSKITNGFVTKGNIYYLKDISEGDWNIYDEDMNYVRGTMRGSVEIPRGFMRIEIHRELVINNILELND